MDGAGGEVGDSLPGNHNVDFDDLMTARAGAKRRRKRSLPCAVRLQGRSELGGEAWR